MRQKSTKALFTYWDKVRDGRRAPRRFEIEPAQIAGLLPETFILERSTPGYRFRLAGTRLCQLFGRELRGADFLALWDKEDAQAVQTLLRAVFDHALVGRATFVGHRRSGGTERYDMCVLPLIHGGLGIDRLLGCMTATSRQPVFDDEPLTHQGAVETDILRLDSRTHGDPDSFDVFSPPVPESNVIRLARHRLRLVEGGLNRRD